MNNFYRVIDFKNILYFALSSIMLYFLLSIVQFFFIGEIPSLYNGRILAAAPILVITSHLFNNKRKYYFFLLIFTVLGLSPAIVKIFQTGYLNSTAYNNLLSFVLVTYNLIIILTLLLRKSFWSSFLAPLPLLFFIMQVGLFWLYYFNSNSLFNVSTVLALCQTNLTESFEYVQSYLNIPLLILALLICLLLVYYGILLISKIGIRDVTKYGLPLLLLIIVVNIWLGYRCRTNIILGPYIEAKNYLTAYSSFNKNRENRQAQLILTTQPYRGLYVVIVGESHSRDYTSAYGYKNNTSPWLKQSLQRPNTLLFTNAFSNHVQTVPCVTYALTAKNQYNRKNLEESLTLLEVAEKAGFNTVWLSNQLQFGVFDTPITTIAQEANQQIWINSEKLRGEKQAYDGEILNRLQQIKLQPNTIVFIHLMGSHANYLHRYPKEYQQFQEDTKLGQYQNTLLYNDHIVQSIYEYFSKSPDFQALAYFSDHGEIPGLGHDTNNYDPLMTRIPFYIICSDKYIQQHNDTFIKFQKAKDNFFTNDLVYNNILGLMNIKIKNDYEAENDLTNESYNNDLARFKTLHGKDNIKSSY